VRDARLLRRGVAAVVAAAVMIAVLLASGPLVTSLTGLVPQIPDLVPLAFRGLLGLAAYAAIFAAASRLVSRGTAAGG
jgi:hypothetical protein